MRYTKNSYVYMYVCTIYLCKLNPELSMLARSTRLTDIITIRILWNELSKGCHSFHRNVFVLQLARYAAILKSG